MPRYDFRCEAGHVTEIIFSMADVPAEVPCAHCPMRSEELAPDDPRYADPRYAQAKERLDAAFADHARGPSVTFLDTPVMAHRVFAPPAAIHFHGPGFYATDVKGRLHRKRRPNVGDSLPKEFDRGAAAIADAI